MKAHLARLGTRLGAVLHDGLLAAIAAALFGFTLLGLPLFAWAHGLGLGWIVLLSLGSAGLLGLIVYETRRS